MAKRTRIIEGTWNCTSCDTRDLPARHRSCPSCNNPREESGQESAFDFGGVDATSGKSLREGVTEEKALSAAAAGVDWCCTYDTYTWAEVERDEESGRDEAPRWPDVRVSRNDRLRREEKYTVRIQYQDDGVKEHLLSPASEAEFLAWRKGQSVSLQVSNLGAVSDVARGDVTQ